MQEICYGCIRVIPGDSGGRFPFCNSLFIDDAVKVVIDPGAGPDKLAEIKNKHHVDLVLNTHYHFDHIAYNYLFDQAEIRINEEESNCFRDRREIAARVSMVQVYGEEWVPGWLDRIARADSPQSPYTPQNRHEWWLSTARLDGTYRWGDVLDFGRTRLEVIAAPGHTAGFSCFYFPNQGVVYTGDIDLTEFGPWYCGTDSDIDQFIATARHIARLDADTFITGHEQGVLTRAEFRHRLDAYLAIIEQREQRILSALTEPLDAKQVAALGLIYGKKYLVDDWVRAWEEVAVEKHLRRLVRKGLAVCRNNKYSRA